MSADRRVRIERWLDAPPDAVFRMWTDANAMQHWYQDGPDWVVVVRALDVRVGGGYRVEFGPPGATPFVETGTYAVVDPPRRLVMTETLENVPTPWSATKVTIELQPDGTGTRLVLTHEGFDDDAQRDASAGGWPGFLDRVGALLRADRPR